MLRHVDAVVASFERCSMNGIGSRPSSAKRSGGPERLHTAGVIASRGKAPRKPASCRFMQLVLDLVGVALAKGQWRSCCPPKGLGGPIQARSFFCVVRFEEGVWVVRRSPRSSLALVAVPTVVGAIIQAHLCSCVLRFEEGVCVVRRSPRSSLRSSLPPRAWGLSFKLTYALVVHKQERRWFLMANSKRRNELE